MGGGAFMDSLCRVRLSVGPSVRLHYRVRSINPIPIEGFLCPRHSKNGGGALSVTPVRASVRASVRPSPLSCPLYKSYTNRRIFMPPPFEEWWRGIKCYPCPCVRVPCVRPSVRPLSKFGVRSITFERLHPFNSNLVCWYIISKHRSSSIWVTIH